MQIAKILQFAKFVDTDTKAPLVTIGVIGQRFPMAITQEFAKMTQHIAKLKNTKMKTQTISVMIVVVFILIQNCPQIPFTFGQSGHQTKTALTQELAFLA